MARASLRVKYELNPSIIVGFGYPVKKIVSKKNRKPLGELVFLGKYGKRFDPQSFEA